MKTTWELSSQLFPHVKNFAVKPLPNLITSTDGKSQQVTSCSRESEVTLESIRGPTGASSSIAPLTGLQFVRNISTYDCCHSLAHSRCGQVLVGTNMGIELTTEDGHSSYVIQTNTGVSIVGMCVSGNIICTLGLKQRRLRSVNVYDSNYELINSWQHVIQQRCTGSVIARMALRGNSLVICDRQTITQYSLDGRVKRQVSYEEIQSSSLSISAMSQSDDVISINNQRRVQRLSIATGRSVWTNDSLPKPSSVCCDGTDGVFVAVEEKNTGVAVAILDGETGECFSVRQRG